MPAEEPTVIDRKNCWIDAVLVNNAKLIAAHDGCTLSEVVERLLRPGIARDIRRVTAKLAEAGGKS